MYKIEFLDDAEFDLLPGKDMEMNLGVAYPGRGEAFVRRTGSNLVDVFTLAHELEHLEGKDLDEHYDKENQCYYKQNSWIAPAAMAASMLIPGVGPALSGALSSIGGGISGALGSVPGIGGALGGAAQSVGGALGNVMGIGGGASIPKAGPSGYDSIDAIRAGGTYGYNAAGPMSAAAQRAGGASIGSLLSNMGHTAASSIMNPMNLFGGSQPSFQMPSMMGSFNPSVSPAVGANVIPGGSGTGSSGFGGAPGSVGGGGGARRFLELQSEQNRGGQR